MYFMLFKWRGIYFVNNVFSFCADSKSSETKTTWIFKQVYTPVSESKQNLNEFITWFSFNLSIFSLSAGEMGDSLEDRTEENQTSHISLQVLFHNASIKHIENQ